MGGLGKLLRYVLEYTRFLYKSTPERILTHTFPLFVHSRALSRVHSPDRVSGAEQEVVRGALYCVDEKVEGLHHRTF